MEGMTTIEEVKAATEVREIEWSEVRQLAIDRKK